MVTINADFNGVTVSADVTGNVADGYTITFTAPPGTAGHTQHVLSGSKIAVRSGEVNGCNYVFTPNTNWGNISSPTQVMATMECPTS